MAIQLDEEDGGKILVVHVSGKLITANYDHFVPEFERHHFRDIDRLAMISEKQWQEAMPTFCKPFTKATVRYFDHAHSVEARQWFGEA